MHHSTASFLYILSIFFCPTVFKCLVNLSKGLIQPLASMDDFMSGHQNHSLSHIPTFWKISENFLGLSPKTVGRNWCLLRLVDCCKRIGRSCCICCTLHLPQAFVGKLVARQATTTGGSALFANVTKNWVLLLTSLPMMIGRTDSMM